MIVIRVFFIFYVNSMLRIFFLEFSFLNNFFFCFNSFSLLFNFIFDCLLYGIERVYIFDFYFSFKFFLV